MVLEVPAGITSLAARETGGPPDSEPPPSPPTPPPSLLLAGPGERERHQLACKRHISRLPPCASLFYDGSLLVPLLESLSPERCGSW